LRYEVSQAAERVAWRACAVSILGGFRDPRGQSPEQPDLNSVLTQL